jgi:ElaB/YqjD/DUF883 family membrane-anchored ribosome-binding protein
MGSKFVPGNFNEGGVMPEALRPDVAARNPHYPTGAPDRELSLDVQLDRPELPERASLASNPALNRSAEVVGRGVGTAVAGVRRLPQTIDRLRSRIHLVPARQGGSSTISDIKESALETAADWRNAAEDTIGELKDRAETYSHDVADRTNRSLEELRHRTEWRIIELRRTARQWLMMARRWESEQPLQVIGSCAALGFAAGVALRIWRSNRD